MLETVPTPTNKSGKIVTADDPEFIKQIEEMTRGFQEVLLRHPDLWRQIANERERQRNGIELIASENSTDPAVLALAGTILTNKYAEGRVPAKPGGKSRRYYGGCEFVDEIEQMAIDGAKQLFGAEHANVQPHAGAQANMAVYFACLQPGDTIMAMNLAHGGHLTHGSPVNFSGKLYNVVPYGVRRDNERIDYDEFARLARVHRPRLIMAGHSSHPCILDFARMKEVADEVGAVFVVDMAHIAGLVAGKQHPSPVPHADFVSSTTHKSLRGPRSGFVLCKKDMPEKIAHRLNAPRRWLPRLIERLTGPTRLTRDSLPELEGRYAQLLDSAVFPGMQGGPLVHIMAAKAACFARALQPDFGQYAAQVVSNAQELAEELARAGFRLVTGGTENHLMMIDLGPKGLTGKIAERALDKSGMTVNKNMIPFDPRTPMDPSGIRIGTPAVTTRGMREPEMRVIGQRIAAVLGAPDDKKVQERVRGAIRDLCQSFPVPGIG